MLVAKYDYSNEKHYIYIYVYVCVCVCVCVEMVDVSYTTLLTRVNKNLI